MPKPPRSPAEKTGPAATAIVWFRRDLRLTDNPALAGALAEADAIVAVATDPPESIPGSAAHAWRLASLSCLDADLRSRGSRVLSLPGDAPTALARIAAATGATTVWCNRVWDPRSLPEEDAVRKALDAAGVRLVVTEAAYLVPPGELVTGSGAAYRVFTPFFRAWMRRVAEKPESAGLLAAPDRIPGAAVLDAYELPAENPGHPSLEHWTPGESAAHVRLRLFASQLLPDYEKHRDRPDIDGTSRLSAHLAHGELSPGRVLATLPGGSGGSAAATSFIRQLAWREFAAHVMRDFPDLAHRPLKPEFGAFPWRDDPDGFESWAEGRTGFALVDAGMRQLAATGWMHNRVRLVTASFLTKDLLVPWQHGLRLFAERLVDHDPASNAFNWQWTAGSGADASPYFRIFNPDIQAARFDPQRAYVRKWVGSVPDGEARLVDHGEARLRALSAYELVRQERR